MSTQFAQGALRRYCTSTCVTVYSAGKRLRPPKQKTPLIPSAAPEGIVNVNPLKLVPKEVCGLIQTTVPKSPGLKPYPLTLCKLPTDPLPGCTMILGVIWNVATPRRPLDSPCA